MGHCHYPHRKGIFEFIKITKISTHDNLADQLTKPVTEKKMKQHLEGTHQKLARGRTTSASTEGSWLKEKKRKKEGEMRKKAKLCWRNASYRNASYRNASYAGEATSSAISSARSS